MSSPAEAGPHARSSRLVWRITGYEVVAGLQRRRRISERDERGSVTILATLSLSLLLVVAALVIDLGYARDIRQQSQTAADASALAAANVLYPTAASCTSPTGSLPPCYVDAITEAKAYANVNFDVIPTDWATCTDTEHFYVPAGQSECISFTDDTLATTPPTQPTKVRVNVPIRNVKTGLGTLAGVSNVAVGSAARATLEPGDARSCGLCMIATGLSNLGNGDVTVEGGSVHTNGSVDTGPNGAITATPAGSATISAVGSTSGQFSPTPIGPPQARTISDPLGSLPLPPAGASTALLQTDPCNQGPGLYGNYQTNSTCQLQPGLYVIVGTWTMGNNSLLKGTGVTLYGGCATANVLRACNSSGEVGGYLNLKNGDSQITAPTTGPLSGYAVMYDRHNTSGLNLQGNGNTMITGTIYAPRAQLEFPGNSFFTVRNGPVVVGSLYGNGNKGGLSLAEVHGANIPVPPGEPSLDQ